MQQEVLTDVRSFNRALIHVLRQDPDVIVVGEMRDHEAISTALTAAETGHLVLATMHSPNVSHAMERIVGVFEGNAQRQIILQLANALQGIIAQDLLPAADRTRRVLAYELLVANGAVRNLIRENQLHQLENTIQTGRKEGMMLMDNCLYDLYCKCLITYDTAVSRARHPDRMAPKNQHKAAGRLESQPHRHAIVKQRGKTWPKNQPRCTSMTVATAAATMSAAVACCRCGRGTGAGRGERGKFLGQFLRAAMRAFRALPVAGADEDFAVALALFAMKFVNRHGPKITGVAENSRRGRDLTEGNEAKSVSEKSFSGSTGDSPVPSGDLPDGTETTGRINGSTLFHGDASPFRSAGRRPGRASRPRYPFFRHALTKTLRFLRWLLSTITAAIIRGGVGGHGSSGPRRRRRCPQTEIAASAIRRGRRKTARSGSLDDGIQRAIDTLGFLS